MVILLNKQARILSNKCRFKTRHESILENERRFRRKHPHYFKEKYTGRTVRFKGKRVWLKENPRKGICTDCGKPGRTLLHHIKYDKSNPLAHTIELCIGCHNRQHRILKYCGKELS